MKDYPDPEKLVAASEAIASAKDADRTLRDARANAAEKNGAADARLADMGMSAESSGGGRGITPPTAPVPAVQPSSWWNDNHILGVIMVLLVLLLFLGALLYLTKANVGTVAQAVSTANEAKARADEALEKAKVADTKAEAALKASQEAKTAADSKCVPCAAKHHQPAAVVRKVVPKPQAPKPAALPPKAVPCTTCVPHEEPKKISESPRGDGRCFVKAQSGTFKYTFELRHETSTGKLMIALVDDNEKVAAGTKVRYLSNEMSVVNEKGVDCDGNQAKLYTNWTWAKQAFGLPSACDIVRKP